MARVEGPETAVQPADGAAGGEGGWRLPFAAQREQTRRLVAGLDAWQGFLRPGVYVAEDEIARRPGAEEDEHLLAHGMLRRRVFDSSPRARLRRTAKTVLGIRRRVVLPEAAAIPAEGAELAGFRGSVLIPKRRKVLILDPVDRRVMHAYFSGRLFRQHAERPDLLLRHVPAPRLLGVAAQRQMLVEELVVGRMRAEWTAEERVAAERFMHDTSVSYLEAARAAGPPAWGATVTPRAVLAAVQQLPGLEELAGVLGTGFPFAAAPALEIPSVHGHGDLRLANLVKVGADFVALDWEFSRVQPFFFDLLHWVFMEWRYHKDLAPLRSLLSGRLDGRLQVAFEAAGTRFEPRLRALYFGVYLADRARDRSLEKTPGFRRRQVAFYRRFLARSDIRRLLRAQA